MTISLESALFVGDTHADAGWLKFVVLPRAVELGVSAIVQVGDFGYWGDAHKFLSLVRTARQKYSIDIYFIDGNHEQHPLLQRDVEAAQTRDGVLAGSRDPIELSPGFFYLPRGAHFEVAGKSVACCGGAASINKQDLKTGVSWFPDERINDLDIEAVRLGGTADILIAHDSASGWRIPGIPSEGVLPVHWLSELPACDEHRDRVREVLELVKPSMLIHGHYHSAFQLAHQEEWGKLDVFGLDCNGSRFWGVVVRQVEGELSVQWVETNVVPGRPASSPR